MLLFSNLSYNIIAVGIPTPTYTVDKIIKRTSGAGNGWEASAEENPAINDHIFREAYQNPLLEMSNIEFRHKDKISYPYIVNPRNSGGNAYAAHRWFGKAKEDRVNLPTIEDTVGDNETLSCGKRRFHFRLVSLTYKGLKQTMVGGVSGECVCHVLLMKNGNRRLRGQRTIHKREQGYCIPNEG